MTKHTKEPWKVSYEGIPEIWTKDRTVHIADLVEIREEKVAPTEAETLANADRIVACVNALEGIDPKAVAELIGACKFAKYMLTDGHIGLHTKKQTEHALLARVKTALELAGVFND